MNHFLADEWDHAHRQKRGGDARVIPLDALAAEERYRFEPVDRLDAARLFDRRWAMTVLEQAISRLESEFADRPKVFGELQSFLVGDGDGRTCADAAANLGMTEVAVRATISRMRKRCRELVRQEIAQTLASISDVEEEYRDLLAALRQFNQELKVRQASKSVVPASYRSQPELLEREEAPAPKCMPSTCDGRFVTAASLVIDIDDVLVARMTGAGSSASKVAKICVFTSSCSSAASMLRCSATRTSPS